MLSLPDNLDSLAPGSAVLVAIGRGGRQGEITIEYPTIGVYVALVAVNALSAVSSVVGPTFELDIVWWVSVDLPIKVLTRVG